ncbi:MAG TPA: DUF551 domain-containing protein [Rhabdochlamydiaceae bacterium]
MSQWIKIEDELPPKSERILTTDSDDGRIQISTFDGRVFWNDDMESWDSPLSSVFAWQPLPEIPEEFK